MQDARSGAPVRRRVLPVRRGGLLHSVVPVVTTGPKAPPLPTTAKHAGGGGWRGHLGSLAFLAPGGIWLLVVTVYPLVATIRNSFYDASSSNFVGTDNYKAIFST